MGESARDFRSARRRSLRAVPIYAGLLVVLSMLLWLASRFVMVPGWLTVMVLGLTGFTLVGDILNVVYCGWRLRRRGDA